MSRPIHERIALYGILPLLLLLVAMPAAVQAADEASPAEVARVRYELSKVEQKLKESGGQSIELSKYDKRAFNMVKEIAGRFPKDPKVAALVDEARALYKRAKGVRFDITPEMLAYRQRGKNLARAVRQETAREWRALRTEIRTGDKFIEKPFPAPKGADVDADELEGSTIIFENIAYDRDLFVQSGRNWVPAGKPTSGFYWISVSGPAFDSLFEALARFRGSIQEVVPGDWTLVCRVVGPDVMVPGAGKQSDGPAYLGWVVEPIAIHIPDTVLVTHDENATDGARYAGEQQVQELIKYSVTAVPEDVQPEQLVRIFITALKEKNFDLHLDCIDPQQRAVPPQVESLRYNWRVSQKGLVRSHAHAEPTEVGELRTTAGDVDKGLEDFFGDKNEPAAAPDYKEERIKVTVRLFDERGKQTVRPRYVTLIRRNGGRWYIYSGATLTF